VQDADSRADPGSPTPFTKFATDLSPALGYNSAKSQVEEYLLLTERGSVPMPATTKEKRE